MLKQRLSTTLMALFAIVAIVILTTSCKEDVRTDKPKARVLTSKPKIVQPYRKKGVRGAKSKSRMPYSIAQRVPWTTSRVHETPDPPPPFRTEIAFPKLKFNGPLALISAPGSDRLFVVEHEGKIYSFINDTATDKADLFLDLGKTYPLKG